MKNPLRKYKALKKIHDSLFLAHDYSIYRKSFHDKVVATLIYNLGFLSEHKRREYIFFWGEHGFKELSMQNLQERDFLTTYAYGVWKIFHYVIQKLIQ